MIVRPGQNWFRLLFIWNGSVLQSIIPQLVFMGAVSSLAVLTHGRIFGEKIPLNTAPFTLFGLALAIFLAFRSHDQYNTTIYALDDRYRGVFGRRDVLFMNEDDMAARGIEHGDLVDIETVSANRQLRLNSITAIAYNIAPGSVAAYYPEANVLVPLDFIDKESGTPSYKSVPVHVVRSAEA